MKKFFYLLITILLSTILIPIVFAESKVAIESIELVKNSNNAVELSPPTKDGLNIGFDLSFVEPNDYAKYKVIIDNPTTEEYEIKKDNEFNGSKYLKYEFEFGNDGNVVKPKSKLTMYITVTYNKRIDVTEYKDGKYEETNAMAISLANMKVENESNPITADKIIVTAAILAISSLILVLTYKTQSKKFINTLIVFVLLVPIVVHAIESIKISITTKVTIEEKRNILEARYLDGNTSIERHFWQYAGYIKNVTFETSIEDPENYEYKFDVSEAQDNGIIAYLVKNKDNSSLYDLYIMCDGYIYANPDSSSVFSNFLKMTKINNFEYYKTPLAETMNSMFSYINSMTELDLSHFNTSNVIDMTRMFAQNFSESDELNILSSINLSSFDTTNVVSMDSMFENCDYLISIDLSSFHTPNLVFMQRMFDNCRSLKSIDLNSFDTSNVTNMSGLFNYCTSLTSIKIDNFDTSKVENMSGMFYRCSHIEELNLSSFNTSNVTDMSYMFYWCRNLTTLDLSSFDTSNVTTMERMFDSCEKLTTLDLSSFDTSKVTDMSYMFSGSYILETIYVGENWTVENVTRSILMFSSCRKLPHFNSSKVDKTNANTSDTGYLTLKV